MNASFCQGNMVASPNMLTPKHQDINTLEKQKVAFVLNITPEDVYPNILSPHSMQHTPDCKVSAVFSQTLNLSPNVATATNALLMLRSKPHNFGPKQRAMEYLSPSPSPLSTVSGSCIPAVLGKRASYLGPEATQKTAIANCGQVLSGQNGFRFEGNKRVRREVGTI